jgi:hypothetical protein
MFPIVLLLAPLPGVAELPLHTLTVTVDTPLVKVAPRASGRAFLNLPRLEYQFALQPACADSWQAAGLSLSIADSRITFNKERVTKDLPLIETRISVPAAQLAPLPLSGFCEIVEDDSDEQPGGPMRLNGTGALTIDAAVSANAALICSSDQQERITYISQPLAVTLVCEPPADASQAVE